VLTASFDGASRIWQADTGKLLRTFALNWYVHSAEFSPDGKSVLTGADDGRAWLWDAETGRAIRHFPTEGVGRVYVAAFSTDGRRVATEDDVTFDVDIWDIASGALLATLRGHNEYVYSIAFSPDGTRIVTASGDRTARIWNAASGRPLQVLRGHEATVFSAYFSPDSRHVVTASSDGTTRVWSVRALPWRCQALIDYARTSAPRQLTDLERREEFLEPRDPAPPVNLFGAGDSCS
jgi:WD40 repeat protein